MRPLFPLFDKNRIKKSPGSSAFFFIKYTLRGRQGRLFKKRYTVGRTEN